MKRLVCSIAFLMMMDCSVSYAGGNDFGKAENLWLQQSQEKNPDRSKYLMALLDQQNGMRLDEQGGCYEKSDGGITQIVTIDKKGVVTSVVSNIKNSKSECFRSLYLGKKFLAPPFAPIYDKMEMGYGDSK